MGVNPSAYLRLLRPLRALRAILRTPKSLGHIKGNAARPIRFTEFYPLDCRESFLCVPDTLPRLYDIPPDLATGVVVTRGSLLGLVVLGACGACVAITYLSVVQVALVETVAAAPLPLVSFPILQDRPSTIVSWEDQPSQSDAFCQSPLLHKV